MLSARQQQCLRGIGIRIWSRRGSASAGSAADDVALNTAADDRGDGPLLAQASGDRLSFAGEARDDLPIAPETGADTPSPAPATHTDVPLTPAPTAISANDEDLTSWDGLNAAVHACSACELAQNCTQKVPGVGARDADLLIIGEGPGHDEDIRGEPFVGRSGQLLDRMLAAIGMSREQVFITNIVKCRPPNNRDPRPQEAQQCRRFLDAQIELIAPRVILSVGRVSAHNLLDCSDPVGKLIRRSHQLPGSEIPLKVTYHPAYLLRNSSAKSIAWQDLKLLHRMLQ